MAMEIHCYISEEILCGTKIDDLIAGPMEEDEIFADVSEDIITAIV